MSHVCVLDSGNSTYAYFFPNMSVIHLSFSELNSKEAIEFIEDYFKLNVFFDFAATPYHQTRSFDVFRFSSVRIKANLKAIIFFNF